MAEEKLTGFLSKDTAGLPNWAWLLIVGAGLAVAYIGPKFFGSKSQQQQQTTGTDTTGLGLAIDPTTGLPYAVEGLVPSGATVGTTDNQPPPPPVQTPTPCIESQALRVCGPGEQPVLVPGAPGCPAHMSCVPGPTPTPTPSPTSIVVGKDVPNNTTVQAIATKYGLSYSAICAFNPWLKCGQPVVNGGAYDFNLPGNVNGQTFVISGGSSGGGIQQPQAVPFASAWPGGTSQVRIG